MATREQAILARAAFITHLAECGNVSGACRRAKVGRATVYLWRANDHEFAAEWEQAALLGASGLEDEARRRAFEGTLKPVFQGGKKVGSICEYSPAATTPL